MGAGMTEDERLDLMRRMLAAQRTIRSLMDYLDGVAGECDDDDQKGMAFSIYMIREALAVYSLEMVAYTRKHRGDD